MVRAELDVYVLGAGASFVHGAPLTDRLVPYALTIPGYRGDERLALVKEFLSSVFHFDAPVNRTDQRWDDAPGLVDILSMVDVAIDRKEGLSRTYDVDQLRKVRSALEFTIFVALDDSLSGRSARRRSKATRQLIARLDPRDSAIISFNYDIIVDYAIARHCTGDRDPLGAINYEEIGRNDRFQALRQHVDYGVPFANLKSRPKPANYRLLKLHGSFNWLRHRVTGDLYYGGLNKAVGIVFGDSSRIVGDLHGIYDVRSRRAGRDSAEPADDFEPVMVTPTHLKDLRNPHLARIWRHAEELLRKARRITFIGYSLPGDDLHVKYLFKHALETRPSAIAPPEIIVVDKGNARTSAVKSNYERFFGKELVTYHGVGFEKWLERPSRKKAARKRSRVS